MAVGARGRWGMGLRASGEVVLESGIREASASG